MRTDIADNIKNAIIKDYKENGWLCVPEMQIGDLAYKLDSHKTNLPTASKHTETKSAFNMRPDIWLVNRNGKIIIVEVKSCRQDFTSDKKYHIYSNFCDLMYFAIDGDYISKDELPKNVGLIKLDNSKRGFKFIKKAKSNNFSLDIETRCDFIFRLARSASNRYLQKVFANE